MIRKNTFPVAFGLLLSLLLIGCDAMDRQIVIELPEPERLLMVECYLEPGQPYRLLLTETKGYFEELTACPLVKGATVIIKHGAVSDTLVETPYFSDNCPPDSLFGILPLYTNADFTRIYNYGSSTICNFDLNEPYELEIIDHLGNRNATASTKFLPIVPIDEIQLRWENNGTGDKASALVTALDDGNTVDFYRLMLHDSSLTLNFGIAKDPEFDLSIDDARFFDEGGKIAFGTNFDYEENDTLIATIYHIEKVYHDFLETLSDAQNANFSPFSQPSKIITNIEGGIGIFTTLSGDRDTVAVIK